MIFTIIGKPGAGKTLYSLKEVFRVLTSTDQVIVSNVSYDLFKLQALLDKRSPNKTIDVFKRVRFLTADQSRKFWLYRMNSIGEHVDLKDVSHDEERQGKYPDFNIIMLQNLPGVFYIIDECHVFFDARSYRDVSMSLTFYNSQHRRFNDDIIFITQFLDLIDKRVKSFSQEFITLRNNANEKFFTLWRGPTYFTAKHYQRPPTNVLTDVSTEVHRFQLDLELAACYDTSSGVAIVGRGQPESRKKRGLPAWTMAIPVIAICVSLWFVPDLFVKGFSAISSKVAGGAKQSFNDALPPAAKQVIPTTSQSFITPIPTHTSTSSTISTNSLNSAFPSSLSLERTYKTYTLRHISPERLKSLIMQLDQSAVVSSLPAKALVFTTADVHSQIQQFDIPFMTLTAQIDVHAISSVKDSRFSIDQVTFPVEVDPISYISSTFNLSSIIVKAARDKGYSVSTQSYVFSLNESVPFNFTRGQEIPLEQTTTTQTSTTTTTTFKAITSSLIMDFVSKKSYVDLNLKLQLQSLIDPAKLTVDSSTLSSTYTLAPTSSLILMNYSSLLNSKVRGLFSFANVSNDVVYLVTLKLSPYQPPSDAEMSPLAGHPAP